MVLNRVKEGKGILRLQRRHRRVRRHGREGVLDPTKVTRPALQNAASVASLLLTTEAMVAELRRMTTTPTAVVVAAWAEWVAWAGWTCKNLSQEVSIPAITLAMVRIAWRDLSGSATVPETLRDPCDLADAAIAKRPLPSPGGSGAIHGIHATSRELSLDRPGLGQTWVASELNFSSDIDLIFAFPEKGETSVGAASTMRISSRGSTPANRLLDESTSDGIVYRVDMRLRPFGDSGPSR